MPEVNGIYRHYKGNVYQVVGIAKCSETKAKLVVYRSIKDHDEIWVRPHKMFVEDVVIDGVSQPRFSLLSCEG